MSRFRVGQGGPWLVCQTLGPDNEVVNSCKTYDEAEERAGCLASQSPDQEVTVYKAVERFTVGRTPVRRVAVNTHS